MNWIKKDALNRAWRTFSQALIAVVVVPGTIAAGEVLRLALTDKTGFEWGVVGENMLIAFAVGAVMSVTAYLHRLKLDPSRLPSLEPPKPPAEPTAQR